MYLAKFKFAINEVKQQAEENDSLHFEFILLRDGTVSTRCDYKFTFNDSIPTNWGSIEKAETQLKTLWH